MTVEIILIVSMTTPKSCMNDELILGVPQYSTPYSSDITLAINANLQLNETERKFSREASKSVVSH